VLEDVRDHIAESSKHIDHAKGVLTEACEDLLHKSKRVLRAGRNATGDFVIYSERRVKNNPKSSVAGAIVAGIAGMDTGEQRLDNIGRADPQIRQRSQPRR
jgi:hypothetical protein